MNQPFSPSNPDPFRGLLVWSRGIANRICFAAFACWIVIAIASAALAQPPRPLPIPSIPVDRLPPPAAAPATDAYVPRLPPAAAAPAPYAGPPAGIDGPPLTGPAMPPGAIQSVIPGETIAPGAIPEEYLPLPGSPLEEPFLGDFADGELFVAPPQKLSAYKSGFFQKLAFTATWFGNSNDPSDLGGTEIDAFLTVAVPAPIKEWPLLITPGINTTLIDGPTVTDLPPRLYFTYVDLMWLPKVVNRWTLLLSVAPSVYGDFDANDFRLTGKALAIYDWVPERLQFVAGVLYLNRENIRLLPAGGLIWTPADWARFELLFPKPKLAVRWHIGQGFEDWIFTTAEFGGNTWPVIRESGLRDNVTYLDYRLLVGFERKLEGGAGYRVEAGYVFGRSIEFTSASGDFDPQDTILLRGGITY
jgi:hypothetical protein